MNEKVYTIQFKYDGNDYSIDMLSHLDYSKSVGSDKLVIVDTIRYYLEQENLYKDDVVAENIRLFGKGGELLLHIN